MADSMVELEVSLLEVSLLEDVDALEKIRAEWTQLLSKSASNEPMLGPIWLINWFEVYGGEENRKLKVLSLRRGQELVGLVPLCSRKVWHGSALPMVRLELLGSGEEEEHETCSEYIGVIAAKGEEQAVAEAFGRALQDNTFGPWDKLIMTAMSSEHVMTPLLARALGKSVQYKVLGGSPFIVLPDTWDTYLSGLSSSRRALVRKSLRAWTKWAGAEPVLKSVTKESELEAAYDMLAELHSQRWQETGHVGAFDSPLFDKFHRKTTLDLFRAGALWLCWLEVEGRPITALYNIVWNQQIRFYQSGRVLDLPKKIRPGLVIHSCAIAESIRRGYTHYDFLAGTTRYKMQLASNVRPLVELSLTRPSVRGKLLNIGQMSLGVGRSLRNEWQNRFPKKSTE